jgi:cytochrome c-type biogenesis protein CcmE
MKITHIIGVVVIAVAIGVIVSMSGDASTYVDFSQAKELALEGSDKKVHVVGELLKSESGNIEGMVYQPQLDPNYFEFQLKDDKQLIQKVVYLNPMPQDFERSEKVVVIGSMKKEVFHAEKILMKCPSKYQDNEFREAGKTDKKV